MPGVNAVHEDAPLANLAMAKIPVDAHIGTQILKPVVVKKQSDKIPKFADTTFYTNAAPTGEVLYMRAPGSTYDMIEWTVSATDTYFCEGYGLEGKLPDEVVANSDDAYAPRVNTARIIAANLLRAQEMRIANLAFDTATTFVSYTATPTAKWDSSTADPWKDRYVAVESMMDNGAYSPDTDDLVFVTGVESWHRFSRNALLVDLVKQTTGALVVTEEQWRQFLQVDKFLVGRGTYNTGKDTGTLSSEYIWGKYGGFYSVPKNPISIGQPLLGMCPIWAAGNGGQTDSGYASRWYRDQSVKSDIFQGDMFTDELVTMPECGYVYSALTD